MSMIKLFRLFAIPLAIAIPIQLSADMNREERIVDAEALVGIIAHRYAPLEWKEQKLGVSFDDISATLLETANRDVSDEEFYGAMARFLASLEDAHVRLIIPSSLTATLGFNTDYFDGEIVVTSIDRKKLDAENFGIEVGDRLVSIDGVPVNDIIAELAEYKGVGHEMAEQRILASWLTNRSQRNLPDIPEGTAKLVFRGRRGDTKNVSLIWLWEGNELAPTGVGAKSYSSEPRLFGENPLDRMRELTTADLEEMFAGSEPESFLPLGPGFQQRARSPFITGMMDVGGHKIGFIKIHTWTGFGASEKLKLIEDEILAFEGETEALIIDQTDNPGGNLCFLEDATGFFLKAPIEKMLFRIRANRRWLVPFEEQLKSLKKYEPDSKDIGTLSQIVEELRGAIQNEQTLTNPFPLCSVTRTIDLPANEEGRQLITYTKPILILVNELDGSAADVFPAIMQDSGRAVIFGSRTIGAGGNVVGIGPMGYSDYTVTVTESLMWRPKAVPDGMGGTTNYIENVGVTPDVGYDIGLADYLENYISYKGAVEDAVLTLIGNR